MSLRHAPCEPYFQYAQVIKHKNVQSSDETPLCIIEVDQHLTWGLPMAVYSVLLKAVGLNGNINTSFVEQVNLTSCHSISKIVRYI